MCDKEFTDVETGRCPVDQTNLVLLSDDDELAGKSFACDYIVAQKIGAGSASVVYKAMHVPQQQTVAVKVLRRVNSIDKTAVRRFKLEVLTNKLFNNEHIAAIHELGVTPDGLPFFIMEYVDGVSLAEHLTKHGPMPPALAVRIFCAVAQAIQHVHDCGVIHRDLKPSDIMICRQGGVPAKLLDFGLAKLMPGCTLQDPALTKPGEFPWNVLYASPEQCSGKKVESSTDVYSLGVVLFETLTGSPPFAGTNPVEIARKHLGEELPRMSQINSEAQVSDALERVVRKMLFRNPLSRYQSMDEVRIALRQSL